MTAPQERPIFLFGCPRSGTSLLSRILNNHPRIAVPFESHTYDYLYGLRGLFTNLEDPTRAKRLMSDMLAMEDVRMWNPPASLEHALARIQRHDFHGFFEALLASWAADRGKPRWGEKTPQHTLFWRELLEGFPDMQVVNVVRDGRDLAVSYLRAFHGPKHVYAVAKRWISYLDTAEETARALGSDAFLQVRYEDLVAHPERTARGICDFLNEDFSTEMLLVDDAAVASPQDDQRGNLARPIHTSSVGAWRQALSRRQVGIFESVASPYLLRYGYTPENSRRRIRRAEAAWYALVEHPPAKIPTMLRNRRSQKITLQRLRIALRWSLGRV